MSATQTLLFVCLHGAGMSRMAAQYFNRAAPADWHAVSAGVHPAEALSSTAASLLAGTGADEFLDQSPPRRLLLLLMRGA
jgi:protein-tyrosine-phosphatase